MVAFIIAVLQGSLRISLLMALTIIMVVLQVTLQQRKYASGWFVLWVSAPISSNWLKNCWVWAWWRLTPRYACRRCGCLVLPWPFTLSFVTILPITRGVHLPPPASTISLHPAQVFGFLTLSDVGLNGFTIVNLCVMVRRNTSSQFYRQTLPARGKRATHCCLVFWV